MAACDLCMVHVEFVALRSGLAAQEVGRIKGQLRDVLLDANKTGKMEEVLSEWRGGRS